MRAVVAVALAMALALATAPPAAAEPLLEPEDAADLAQTLADAQAEQGVCYGWTAQVDALGVDAGSSIAGPGQALQPDPTACPKGYVVFQALIDYTGEYEEAEDSVRAEIESSLASAPTIADLEELGLPVNDLLGEQDDKALFDLVGALPLLVAEKGAAPYVAYEPAGPDVPATDRPTNKPGSDFLRTAGPILGFGAFLVLAGILWFFYKRAQLRGRTPT